MLSDISLEKQEARRFFCDLWREEKLCFFSLKKVCIQIVCLSFFAVVVILCPHIAFWVKKVMMLGVIPYTISLW